ncbi:hypothetical protein CYLTODRAFT_488208 [Cylindrobasidium torrendii FP15055 ss-10]|uniref:Zn(2)-C6 fungal-type domain-containing protein n=1 Tax=Cylindrobasidium torrendii FP15055 ss-10 TaxID=1314674 RepID=A0A0D7BIA1_9AGAR|nr:hypothetical protein CYLTODRAFT_488208 [Cylindrobasidium torrendii FP15055 ss-10]
MREPQERIVRQHRKTRTGCLTCRKRRIKCDEASPICLNCDKREVECVWKDSPQSSPSNMVASTSSSPPTPNPSAAFTSMVMAPTSAPLDWTTMELMHHFTGPFCSSIQNYGDASISDFWRTSVPNLAFSTQATFLLHSMLAAASFHLSYLHRGEPVSLKYTFAAKSHYEQAKAGVLTVCHDVDPLGITIMSFILLALSHFSHHHTPLSVENLRFLRSHSSREQMQHMWRTYASGPLGPLLRLKIKMHMSISRQMEGKRDMVSADYEFPAALTTIHLVTSGTPDPEEVADPYISDLYRETVDFLKHTWVASFQPGLEYESAFTWLVLVADAFLELYEQRRPRAMCIMAQYCAIMEHLSQSRDIPWWLPGPELWQREAKRMQEGLSSEWDPWLPGYVVPIPSIQTLAAYIPQDMAWWDSFTRDGLGLSVGEFPPPMGDL